MQSRAPRIQSLDVSRGVLVCGMIVFHVIVHLYQGTLSPVYLAFISAGFTLFSGLLVSRVVSAKKSPFRIVLRGVKLLTLFLVCNLPLWIHSPFPLRDIVRFVTLTDPQVVSFEILVPIAWTVICSPLVLRLHPTVTILSSMIALAAFDVSHTFPFTLKFLIIGMMGIGIGSHPALRFFASDAPLRSARAAMFVIASVLLYAVLGTWNIDSWLLQSIVVILLFTWIPSAASRVPVLASALTLLGQYSLPLYIVHVTLIALFASYIGVRSVSTIPIIAIMIVLGVACLLLGWMTQTLTRRYAFAHAAYRTVFA